jgi:hypothetical protein
MRFEYRHPSAKGRIVLFAERADAPARLAAMLSDRDLMRHFPEEGWFDVGAVQEVRGRESAGGAGDDR